MYRKIRARFPGKCAKCGNRYAKYELIFWEKGNRATFHSLCYGTKSVDEQVKETQVTPTAANGNGDTMTISVAELKELAVDVLNGKRGELTPANMATAEDNLAGGTWAGFDPDSLRDWIRNGYKAKAFQNMQAESPPIRKRRKMIFADEGEMQVDLALSGFDTPFISWTKRESAPGLRVDVQANFLSDVSADVIEQYQTWVARLLYTLESNGFDLEVNVFSVAVGYMGRHYDRKGRVTVNVKQAGKISDFSRWSVMFSPAGFRGLIFAARNLQCSRMGLTCDKGMGQSVAPRWDVEFDDKTRHLTIRTDRHARNFPEQEMDLKVRAFISKYH